MAKGFKHGGSGGANPLNFTVKAYPSEVELNTATAAKNTIGVVTNNPITGWHFTIEQPENMKDGEVWFGTGKFSAVEFNALKKNNVTVYPISAKQMVSGTLKDVTAKTYRDAQWVEWWDGYLYKNGNEYNEITGGWQAREWGYNTNNPAKSAPVITKDTNSITVTFSAKNTCGVMETANDIDLSGKSVLKVNITELNTTGSNVGLRFAVVPRNATYWGTSAVAIVEITSVGEHSVDLTGVNKDQKYDIILGGSTSTVSANYYAVLDKMWME